MALPETQRLWDSEGNRPILPRSLGSRGWSSHPTLQEWVQVWVHGKPRLRATGLAPHSRVRVRGHTCRLQD